MHKQSGLMDGTRLIKAFMSRDIEAQIVIGSHAGQIALIPRLNMTSSGADQPFTLHARQYPVMLAFAINKAQGQTFDSVGIYLLMLCFSHGQVYVATSSVRKANGVRSALPRSRPSV